jgi:NAD(P)-dependent dehydrogenase (short-subunit alcohol dehydrogenase family)
MPNQTAIVVGVGPGLGAALVRKFAGQGLDVLAVGRSASTLECFADDTGQERIHLYDCDASDPAAVATMFGHAADSLGPLQLVVFNAGAFVRGEVAETDPAEFERCWRVGALAGFLVGQGAAKVLLEEGSGTIIFTGATASLRGGAGFSNLASPKFALRAIAQSLARELGPKNIHVAHVIIDGQILSERNAHLQDERGPHSLLDPAAIAETYWHLHTQQRSAWTQELDLRPWVEKF